MNGDWYGSSITTHEPSTVHALGYAVSAHHPHHPDYLCLNLGRYWPSAEAAREWLDSLLPTPGGSWSYTVVELREVVR
jgi:hypothetical protein